MSHRGWMDPALPPDFIHRIKTLAARLDAAEQSPRHVSTPVVWVRGDAGTDVGDGTWVSLTTSEDVENMGIVWRGAAFCTATRLELGISARLITSGTFPSLTVFFERADYPATRTAVLSTTLGAGLSYEVPTSVVQPFVGKVIFVDVEVTLSGPGTKLAEVGLTGPTTFRPPEAV